MPKYNKGDENKYFPVIATVLVLLASVIGYFLYSVLKVNPSEYEEVYIEEIGGNLYVNPGSKGPATPPPDVLIPVSGPLDQ